MFYVKNATSHIRFFLSFKMTIYSKELKLSIAGLNSLRKFSYANFVSTNLDVAMATIKFYVSLITTNTSSLFYPFFIT